VFHVADSTMDANSVPMGAYLVAGSIEVARIFNPMVRTP
jgi:hypothetical protein